MVGVVTRNEEETGWAEFDAAFFEMKDVTGRSNEPATDAVNMISCFGDNAAAEGNPDLVPVSADGERATREQPYFDWDYVCPTHEAYREGLLEMVADAAAVNEDVRLDEVGFPRREFCRCERCEAAFEASSHADWMVWRASVVTEFVETASELIPGRLYLTLYPDPYPGHLRERTGIDVSALADTVDEFVVPLYDMGYTTTYWIEVIASGFVDLLEGPFSLELYAVDVDVDNLVDAMDVADAYGERVLLGYDATTARGAIRRRQAEQREGESFGT